MTTTGRIWRIIGTLLLVSTWWVASSGGLLVMAIWGFLGLLTFFSSWSIAAWFDVHQEDER